MSAAAPGAGLVVEAEGLVKTYGKRGRLRRAVDGLDLAVRRGAVTALLGPNGAGKTTTVEICEGFRLPDAGQVRVLGANPASRELRSRVGVMLQSGGVYPGARPEEMVRVVASFHANPLEPDSLVERVGLTGSRGTTCRRLSGGQRQRLALALAVVGRPELVFLDEPTAGLDLDARHTAWDLVRELRADGVSVVLTTHDLDEAQRLSDDVVIIDAGRVLAAGSTAGVTASARREVRFSAAPSLDLTSLRCALPACVTTTEGSPGQYLVWWEDGAAGLGRGAGAGHFGGCDIGVDGRTGTDGRANSGAGVMAVVAAWCADNGVATDDLRLARRTLEEAFLELTGRGARS